MADDTSGTPATASGTTAPAADGAAVKPDGGAVVEQTPEQLRAEIARLEALRQQDLARLNSGEDARKRADELAAENERLRESRGYQPPTADDPAAAQFQRDYQDLAARDEVAARLITTIGVAAEQRARDTERRTAYGRELDAIPADMKDEVEKRCKATPGLSPSWARKDIESEMYRSKQSALDERQRKLDEEEAARKRGRVDVSVTPIPGADLSTGDMTPAEYARLCELAEKRDRKALQRLKDFDEGRVKMRSPG